MAKITGDFDEGKGNSNVKENDAAYKFIHSNEPKAVDPKADAAYKYINKQANNNDDKISVIIVALAMALVAAAAGISSITPKQVNYQAFNKETIETKPTTEKSPEIQTKTNESDLAINDSLDAQNKTSPAELDPAIEVADYFSFAEDESATYLVNSEDEYKRAVGDLARIQQQMLKKRSESRNYPEILIGNSYWIDEEENALIEESTAGAYHIKKRLIQINFESEGFSYQKPIEVLTTLAHEYGHHLTEISMGIRSMSGLESELVADCFAGVVMGYWAKYDKLSEAELRQAGNLMIRVSKHSESMTDDHGDPGQRLGAFLAGAIRPSGKITKPYANFCMSLEKIIDFERGLP